MATSVPPLPLVQSPKWTSAGGIVLPSLTLRGMESILLVSPAGSYGGYEWTLPKGRTEIGEDLTTTARRETREESGVEASLLPNGYLGEYEGTFSFTHYFMMLRVGGIPGFDSDTESARVEWVPWMEAFDLLHRSVRDTTVLVRAWEYVERLRRRLM